MVAGFRPERSPPASGPAGSRHGLERLSLHLPGGAAVRLFVVGPFFYAIFLSFYSWDLLTPAEFVGLENFREMVDDPLLRKALRNTFVFAFASVVTHVVGGLLLALAVNRLKNRDLSYFVRTSLFFPFVISWAAVALLWRYVLSPSFGMVSYYAGKIGVTPPDWFNDPTWTLPAIIGIDWWHTIGFTFVIMLAGLQTVPRSWSRRPAPTAPARGGCSGT